MAPARELGRGEEDTTGQLEVGKKGGEKVLDYFKHLKSVLEESH